MQGKKIWHSRKALINFGLKYCLLEKKESIMLYEKCYKSVEETIKELQHAIQANPNFANIGQKMIDIFIFALQEKPTKKLPVELIRSWQKS